MMIATPVLFILILIIALILAAMMFRRSPRRAQVTEPVCGGCGYSTIGLDTLTCPECGNDLRTVGVLTPMTPLRRGPGFVGGLFLVTVVIGALALLAGSALFFLLPRRTDIQLSTALIAPESKQYAGVDIAMDGARWEGLKGQRQFPVRVEMRPTPGSLVNAKGPPSLRLQSETITDDDILKWLASAGIDVTRPGVSTEATRVAVAAQRMRRIERMPPPYGGFVHSSRSSSGSIAGFGTETTSERRHAAPPDWAIVPIGLFWFVLWMGAVRYLWHIRRLA